MKISKEKRTHLIILAVITIGVIGALCYFLIGAQNAKINELSEKISQSREKQRKMDMAVKTTDRIQEEFDTASEQMNAIKKEMASGDYYSWMYNTIKDFKAGYHVDIPQFSSVDVADCSLIYKFPYKQVRMTVSGSGYFHDLGKFIADFENHFPHVRLQNLEISPGGGASSSDHEREKLAFHMEIIALAQSTEAK